MTVRALSPSQAKRFWIYLRNRAEDRTHNPRDRKRKSDNALLMAELAVYRRLLDTFSGCFRQQIRSVDDVSAMGGRQTAAFLRSLDEDIAGLHTALAHNERLCEQARANPTDLPRPASAYQEIRNQLEYQLTIFESMRVGFEMRLTDSRSRTGRNFHSSPACKADNSNSQKALKDFHKQPKLVLEKM